MHLRHSRHFLRIADCGSLTRAAEQLGMAQTLPMLELSAIWPARSRPTLADAFAQLLAKSF